MGNSGTVRTKEDVPLLPTSSNGSSPGSTPPSSIHHSRSSSNSYSHPFSSHNNPFIKELVTKFPILLSTKLSRRLILPGIIATFLFLSYLSHLSLLPSRNYTSSSAPLASEKELLQDHGIVMIHPPPTVKVQSAVALKKSVLKGKVVKEITDELELMAKRPHDPMEWNWEKVGDEIPLVFHRVEFGGSEDGGAGMKGSPVKSTEDVFVGKKVSSDSESSLKPGETEYDNNVLKKPLRGGEKKEEIRVEAMSSLEAGDLELRLRDWEMSPKVEPADWVARNMFTCPPERIRPNMNKVQLEKSHLLWSSMNTSRVISLRTEMISFMREAKKEGRMKNVGRGKGLVFTAGNADTFTRTLLTLKLLHKHLKTTTLPSEIFSFPGEIPDPDTKRQLEEFGATFRVVEGARKDGKATKSYHIKATAIIASSFGEVLYLDSDNMPTAGLTPLNPSYDDIVDFFSSSPAASSSSSSTPDLVEESTNAQDSVEMSLRQMELAGAKAEGMFNEKGWDLEAMKKKEIWGDSAGLWEAKAYKRLGAMFWPDYWRTGADNPIWSIIGVQCRDEWEQEAGQILIDKSLHLDALILAEWMMSSEGERFRFWFEFSDGDKDMFRYAFLALRKRWGVPGRYVGVGAFPTDAMSGFGGHTMMQHDHRGRPIFVHANLLKQIPSGIGKGYAWGKTKSLNLFPSALTLPSTSPEVYTEDLELDPPDLDVDCDQLANADVEGRAIKIAGPATRRRAAIERGTAAEFHGGWISALCIDMKYNDPRSPSELLTQQNHANEKIGLHDHNAPLNVTTTLEGMEIYWENTLKIREWKDDVRLRDFEEVFFEEGGVLSAPGF